MEQQEPTKVKGWYVLGSTNMQQQEPTKVKGWYVLGSTDKSNTVSFSFTWKPKWLHRQMMRIFFGWYWVDEK